MKGQVTMAQANENLNINQVSEEEADRPGKISKFFYLGLVPFLYTVALVGVLLYFGGYDVLGKAKTVSAKAVTLYKHFAPKPKAASTKDPSKNGQSTNTQNSAGKTNSSTAIDNRTAGKGSLNNPIGNLSGGASGTASGSTGSSSKSGTTTISASTAASIERMDPGAAAKILANMDESVAVQYLKDMKPNKITDILSGMDPQKAARLTTLLGWSASLPNPTSRSDSQMATVYQHMTPDQIAALIQKMPQDEMLKQIKLMDNATVAQVLPLLDPKVAGWIITQLH
jgi:flagellar protein FlbB